MTPGRRGHVFIDGLSIRAFLIATSTASLLTAMTALIDDSLDSNILRSVVEHVFMPPKLPQEGPSEQAEQKLNVALCNFLIGAGRDFLRNLRSPQSSLWVHMIKMMESAYRAATAPFDESDLQGALSDLALGGTFI